MQDFRLKVFLTAARTLNFTRCAAELYISQPAVSKHISELELHYGVKLFVRRGSRIELTEAGKILEQWSERITSLYTQLEYQMGLLGKATQGELRIGASTTISQYILPEVIAKFRNSHPDIRISMISDNSEKIEQALFAHEIDLGFTENLYRRSSLKYGHFLDDRLAVVAKSSSPLSGPYPFKALINEPFVLRENGSGTLEIISSRLNEAGISLSSMNIVASLGSSEAIKSYIEASDALAIISIAAVKKEIEDGRLKELPIEDISFEREFCHVTCHGDQNLLSDLFLTYASNNI